MKKFLISMLALLLCACMLTACEDEPTKKETTLTGEKESDEDTCTDRPSGGPAAEKPVIYLYPETDTVCSVKVEINGELSCTYPEHGIDGWQNFTASPDGTLTFSDGNEYYCLYWESTFHIYERDFSKGFCIKGSESAEFLNSALLQLGLTPREANEFIIYWLPKLEANEYNLLSFQFDNYANSAPLEITPAPDSILRVFLAMKPLDEYVEIEPQELPSFERKGFTVVEWGGTWVE